MVVYSGRTVEQAIEKGLKDLNLPRMKAHIKVISREKKGFLGFGKKPARVSVEPINEKIAHEADQNTVKVAPDAIKQLDDSVASPKDETIAFNKVTKLVAVSDNKEIAHEDLKQPVSTETLDEELPDKKQEQPKATIIPLSVKRELSEEGATESMANSLEPQLEPVTQVQTSETSEGAFSSLVSSEFSSDESSENNLEDIQGAADDVLSYLEKIIYEMDVDASLEVSHNRRNIIIQIETDQPGRVIGYHGKVLKSLQLLAKSYLSVLALAEKNNIESIAIPCLSTGDFNFPKQKAAKIAIQTVKTFIDESSIIKKVIFNVFDDENLAIYQKLLAE